MPVQVCNSFTLATGFITNCPCAKRPKSGLESWLRLPRCHARSPAVARVSGTGVTCSRKESRSQPTPMRAGGEAISSIIAALLWWCGMQPIRLSQGWTGFAGDRPQRKAEVPAKVPGVAGRGGWNAAPKKKKKEKKISHLIKLFWKVWPHSFLGCWIVEMRGVFLAEKSGFPLGRAEGWSGESTDFETLCSPSPLREGGCDVPAPLWPEQCSVKHMAPDAQPVKIWGYVKLCWFTPGENLIFSSILNFIFLAPYPSSNHVSFFNLMPSTRRRLLITALPSLADNWCTNHIELCLCSLWQCPGKTGDVVTVSYFLAVLL